MVLEKTTLQVEKGLLEKFQEAVVRRFGKLKGAQSEALAEAMKLWLSYTGGLKSVRLFGGVDTIIELEQVPKVVIDKLKLGVLSKSDISIIPLFFRFETADFEALRSWFEKALNIKSSIEEVEGGKKAVWRLDERNLFEVYFAEKLISFGVRLEEPGFKELSK